MITKEELQQGLGALESQHKEAIKDLQEQVLEKSQAGVESANKRLDEVIQEKNELSRRLGELEAKQENDSKTSHKSFNDILSETLKDNADKIKRFGKGDKLDLEMKAVGNMSPSNFTGTAYSNITTDFRQGVLPIPQERIWLRDILPSGSTDESNIWYPRHTGGEGGVAPWKHGQGNIGANTNKPQVDFDFDGQTVPVEWLAGTVKVPRNMLQDVKWLESFLRENLMLSLLIAENNQILNGSGVSPQIDGIIPNATAYDGTYGIGVERIVDAGFGQVNSAYGNANVVLLHPRDAVSIILNKADGSDEYDLPPGTIGYVNNNLTIAGMRVIQTTEMTQGNFLAGDNRASQLITRMSPEIRMFEQNEDDARKNMVMFRIEERIALAHYYPQWWVKGTLLPTT